MASPYELPSGLQRTGSAFAAAKGLHYSGAIWFVDSATGVDAAAPAGLEEEEPLATLAQAITNVGAALDQIIVLAAGHVEAIAASLAINMAGLWILGCGAGSAKPALTCNHAGMNAMLAVTAGGVTIENCRFPISTGGASPGRITLGSPRGRVKNCDFYCGNDGANSDVTTLSVNAGTSDSCTVSGCTFTAAGNSKANQPTTGLMVNGACDDFEAEGNHFYGGPYGWAGAAFRINAAPVRMRILGNYSDRFSDFSADVTGTTYITNFDPGQWLGKVYFTA